MTNYEKLKNMTLEEVAKFLCAGYGACEGCAFIDEPTRCKEERSMYENWLYKEDCFTESGVDEEPHE